MKPRGGFCAKPFGNHPRLDRLNLADFARPEDPPEKMLYLHTITDAVHNYKFFGLGRNGTTAEEFAYACEYLFHIRASDPSTWQQARMMSILSSTGNARATARMIRLSDTQLREMCFDVHFELAGLSHYLDLDRFTTWLQRTRRQLLEDNWMQVSAYMDQLYLRACQQAAKGQQLPLPTADRLQVLTNPRSPADVAALLYLPHKYCNPN